MITRGAEENGSVQVGYGSFETKTASFSAGIGDDDAGATIAGAWLDSEGFPTQAADDIDRGSDNLSFTASAHGSVGPADVGARAWHASGNTEYSLFGTPLDQDFQDSAFALYAGFAPAASWNSRVTAGYAVDEIDQNQLSDFDLNGIQDFVHTRRWSLDWQNDFALSESSALTAGVLWQDDDVDAESFDLPYEADTATGQVYVQSQSTFGRHRLLLAAAYLDHETFGGHETWNAAYGFAIGGSAHVTLAAGTAFRAPDATDLYGFGSNPELEPEESQSYEISYRQQLGERQSFSLTAFRNDIDDLIDFFVTDPDTFEGENRNVDEARIEGVEAEWRYDDENWSTRVAATWQDPRDEITDERLLRRARENYTLGALRRFGEHEVGLDVLYAGERRDFGFPTQTQLPAYWLANLSAKVALAKGFTCFCERRTCSTRITNWPAGTTPWARAFSGRSATSSAEGSAWATGCRRSTRAPGTTARPASATAAACPRTARGSRRTAAWTRRTARSAWSSPSRACRRMLPSSSRACSTSCSTSAASSAFPAIARSSPRTCRRSSARSTSSTTACRH